jgi:hypothetical protein
LVFLHWGAVKIWRSAKVRDPMRLAVAITIPHHAHNKHHPVKGVELVLPRTKEKKRRRAS